MQNMSRGKDLGGLTATYRDILTQTILLSLFLLDRQNDVVRCLIHCLSYSMLGVGQIMVGFTSHYEVIYWVEISIRVWDIGAVRQTNSDGLQVIDRDPIRHRTMMNDII